MCQAVPLRLRLEELLMRFGGIALIDESDFSRSDLYAPIMKILNIGPDRKLGWYNCCNENDSRKILVFMDPRYWLRESDGKMLLDSVIMPSRIH